jgi:hypothetical protein
MVSRRTFSLVTKTQLHNNTMFLPSGKVTLIQNKLTMTKPIKHVAVYILSEM